MTSFSKIFYHIELWVEVQILTSKSKDFTDDNPQQTSTFLPLKKSKGHNMTPINIYLNKICNNDEILQNIYVNEIMYSHIDNI